MKANELMIGDWVYVSKDFTQKYHKIRALSNDEDAVLRGIYVNEYGVENNSVFSLNDTEPIPLTPEILEKNGFVNVENTQTSTIIYSFSDSLFRIGVFDFNHITMDSYYTDSSCDIFVSSVHELQHALRLCGIEKEIML